MNEVNDNRASKYKLQDKERKIREIRHQRKMLPFKEKKIIRGRRKHLFNVY